MSDLARLANDHWVAAYRALIDDLRGEWREFGTVHAFLGGVPLPFANGCLVLDPGTPSDLAAAIEWVADEGVPYRVRIDRERGAEVMGVPLEHGLIRDPEPMPGMVLRPIPEIPAPAAGVSARRVDAASYDTFLEVLAATGLPVEWASISFPRRLVDEPDTAMFIGYLEDTPAASSFVTRTGDTAGIYAVGTAEAARRRGVGSAVTWAAVGAARDWGCAAVVLQASEMGYPVYRTMGFESVVDYARFMPAETSQADDR